MDGNGRDGAYTVNRLAWTLKDCDRKDRTTRRTVIFNERDFVVAHQPVII